MNQVERCPWCNSEISRAKFVEIAARIRAEEQRKALANEAQTKKTLEEDYRIRLENEKKKVAQAAIEQAEKALKPQLEGQMKALQTAKQTEKALKSQLNEQKSALDEQRIILAREREKELAKKENAHKREMEKMQAQLTEMSRRLQKKTATELGETPEIDLFETLRDAYPEDKIVRVKRGEAGADIHQTVIHRNQSCGLIILDSKNHLGWRNDFAVKLRQDQLDAKADHAILSTTVFPSGHKELCIVNGVIAVSPVRATYIVQILRDAMISLHKQGLSLQKRQTKVDQLYQLITSAAWGKKLADAVQLSETILDLDVDEQKQHQKTWKTRGALTTNLKKTLHGLDDDVFSILGEKGAEDFEGRQFAQEEEVPF